MRQRAAARLAWSLVTLSVALLLGGIALALVTRSTVPDLPFGGETEDGSVVADLVTLLTFSVVGAIIASRHPRNTIRLALLQRRRDDRPQLLRGGLHRVLARERFRHE